VAEPITLDDLQRACRSTSLLVDTVPVSDFELPTPCADWDVRGLIEHIVGATDYFADVAEHGASPEDKVWPTYTDGELAGAFTSHATRLVQAFSRPGALERPMTLPIGDVPGSTCIAVATGEIFQHGWDLAAATGRPDDVDQGVAESLLASEWMELCDKVRTPQDAAFGPAVSIEASAAVADRLAARLGRLR
jgi:uncharacterized protein (TIGR03086 family)